MNWFDLTVLIILLIAAVNGYRKGLIAMLGGFAIIILAAIFGGKLAKTILPTINGWFDLTPNMAGVLSYIIAFLAIAIVISLLIKLMQSILQSININLLNRLLGLLVSLGSTMLIMSILLNLILMLDFKEKIIEPEIKQNSFFYERVQVVVPAIVPFLDRETWEEYVPKKYRDQIEKGSPYEPIDSHYQKKYFETDSI